MPAIFPQLYDESKKIKRIFSRQDAQCRNVFDARAPCTRLNGVAGVKRLAGCPHRQWYRSHQGIGCDEKCDASKKHK
jgi:hypothetical protein